MMDYSATGLPQDPTVFKAYKAYEKNAQELAQLSGLSEDYGLHVAQVLQSTAGDNPQLLSLALLSTTPPEIRGILKKSFGDDIVNQMDESAKHTRTGYAYIDQASNEVMLLTMAASIAAFDDMKQKAEKLDAELDRLENGGASPEDLQGLVPEIMMMAQMMPDPAIYTQVSRTLADKTSCPALEQLFAEKLEEFSAFQQTQRDRLRELGIMIMTPGAEAGAPAWARYPSFEETGLLDDSKVRAAYDVLTNNPLLQPHEFEGALEASKILSTLTDSKNPLTVAAALIDIGLPAFGKDDADFLQKKLDWDVLEHLAQHRIRSIRSLNELQDGPVEFRQIVAANMTAQLGHLREGIDTALEHLANQAPDFGGMDIPEDMQERVKAQVKAQAAMQMQVFAAQSQRLVGPLLGKLDAPALEASFAEKLQSVNEFVRDNRPNPRDMLEGFKPRKPKKPGNDLSFDE